MIFSIFVIHPFISGFHECLSDPQVHHKGYMLTGRATGDFVPKITPTASPQPFLPLLAPSPLSTFTNSTSPKLSGMFYITDKYQVYT